MNVASSYNWHSQVIILLNVIQVCLVVVVVALFVVLIEHCLSTRNDLVILSQLSSAVRVGVIVDIDSP